MTSNDNNVSSVPEVDANEIETEANSYIRQVFSAQLTVDAIIQMLARFKESSETRERSIYESVIANLLDEYKFFNQYPDKQLKIVAALFGMLIKNEIVTHLTLGIAMRAVLDALRKPADSKMFVFGTKALEQFVDRLNEWPQFRENILKFSHLRGAQPELVASIETVLARNSSSKILNGHSYASNAAANNPTDQNIISSSTMTRNGSDVSSIPEVYANDVVTEADSYIHQVFSAQLTVDEMIQMLARFKESSETRERSIYECVIANVFEKYKYINQYPDKQLKIVAAFFGLLIKNELATHLILGIALQAVLDALRKPADSKKFVFGTKALEQFVDRLIEWPQFAENILKISHLRDAHPELVASIETVLARNSSSHPDSKCSR